MAAIEPYYCPNCADVVTLDPAWQDQDKAVFFCQRCRKGYTFGKLRPSAIQMPPYAYVAKMPSFIYPNRCAAYRVHLLIGSLIWIGLGSLIFYIWTR